MFFLRGVLGSNVAVRGGNLKKKGLEEGWGGGRSASPPDALGVFACVFFLLFFVFFLCFCRGFFVSVSTGARGTRGWLMSGGEQWPYMIAADVQRIIPA